ncbi:MAG: hypothetical protein AAFR04_15725 [Pseudomonadota bacterium]
MLTFWRPQGLSAAAVVAVLAVVNTGEARAQNEGTGEFIEPRQATPATRTPKPPSTERPSRRRTTPRAVPANATAPTSVEIKALGESVVGFMKARRWSSVLSAAKELEDKARAAKPMAAAQVVQALRAKGFALSELERHDQAAKALLEALKVARKHLGETNKTTGYVAFAAARAFLKNKKRVQAVKHMPVAVGAFEKAGDKAMLEKALLFQAVNTKKLRRYREAMRSYGRLWKLSVKDAPPGARHRLEMLTALGELSLELKRPQNAVAYLKRAIFEADRNQAGNDVGLIDKLYHLMRAQRVLGNNKQADVTRTRLAGACKQLNGLSDFGSRFLKQTANYKESCDAVGVIVN